jgi:hypothetical protein
MMHRGAKSGWRKATPVELAPGKSVAALWDHGADLIVQF